MSREYEPVTGPPFKLHAYNKGRHTKFSKEIWEFFDMDSGDDLWVQPIGKNRKTKAAALMGSSERGSVKPSVDPSFEVVEERVGESERDSIHADLRNWNRRGGKEDE